MKKQNYIKVPFMEMPICCDDCPFAVLKFSTPLSDGRKGFNCKLEFYEKGKYETVREAPYDEKVVPVLCPLIKANKGLNPNWDILTPTGEGE